MPRKAPASSNEPTPSRPDGNRAVRGGHDRRRLAVDEDLQPARGHQQLVMVMCVYASAYCINPLVFRSVRVTRPSPPDSVVPTIAHDVVAWRQRG